MALFGGARDASFIRRVNREVMQRIIDVEVSLFKISLDVSQTNIYQESTSKAYYAPVRLHVLVTSDDTMASSQELGLHYDKTIMFAFLRDDLVDKNIVAEIGDIIQYDNAYYEIDNIRDDAYWFGRNPQTLLGNVHSEINEHGYSVSIIAETHRSQLSALNIIDVRAGANPLSVSKNKTWGHF